MSIYYCLGCDKYVDDDYHPMEISELCPECHLQAQEEGSEILTKAQQYELEQKMTALSLQEGQGY